ncbi:hypothetical protein TRFO_30608 [Tritrichomonas foetus]|uniref:Uncharacterized protein n=1 Tax=Tritrichomonas foetus TaxID=1144522 RepID=A0A1J4JV19_9EUKA|nr:hypothetical protein TRFO_30608 [Tritrichomonas foetus]|eukprot:OHT02288.1 hypothetical protein TRFO_30608 [Tritrichomonas foetus]
MTEESKSPAWGPSIMPEVVAENRRRAMQSNLFSDPPAAPQRQYNPPQTVNKNINNTNSPSYENSQRSPQPTFMSPPPKSVQLPQFSTNISAPEVPALSPFPDFSLDIGKINESFDLGVKPRPPVENKPLRKLNFTTGNQMKIMRDDLNRDFSEFAKRMKRLSSNETLKLETIKFAERPIPKPSKQNNSREHNIDSCDRPLDSNNGEYNIDYGMNTMNNNNENHNNMNTSMNRSVKINPSLNRTQTYETEEEAPSFTTVSEFLLPDGTTYA